MLLLEARGSSPDPRNLSEGSRTEGISPAESCVKNNLEKDKHKHRLSASRLSSLGMFVVCSEVLYQLGHL